MKCEQTFPSFRPSVRPAACPLTVSFIAWEKFFFSLFFCAQMYFYCKLHVCLMQHVNSKAYKSDAHTPSYIKGRCTHARRNKVWKIFLHFLALTIATGLQWRENNGCNVQRGNNAVVPQWRHMCVFAASLHWRTHKHM